MADWKITLTRAVLVNGTQRTLQSEVVLGNLPRNLPPVALVEGIDKLLKQAKEIVPEEARTYWQECRSSGSKQIYEIQSELDTNWGITFGAQEVVDENSPAPPQQAQQNGKAPEPQPDDLDTMLKNQLKVLQARNATLNADIEKKTAERDKNDASILRIAQFLAIQSPDRAGVPQSETTQSPLSTNPPVAVGPRLTPVNPPKKRGRPKVLKAFAGGEAPHA